MSLNALLLYPASDMWSALCFSLFCILDGGGGSEFRGKKMARQTCGSHMLCFQFFTSTY